ncbi:MAG: alpha/beta hydrolase [Anaerolineaceae bacterium]
MTDHQSTSNLLTLLKISLVLMVGISACNLLEPQPKTTETPTVIPTNLTPDNPLTEEPSPTQTAAPCTETTGTVIDRQVPSKLLAEPINIKIYLPPCYDSKNNTQYSVLYMLHGQTSMDDQWVRIGLLSKMDELLADKKVKPFLIVLPNEIRSNADSDQSKYGDAIIEEVIPFVEKQFNTCNEKACRAIGGLSRGGNWAVHLGFSNPELFSTVGAHSTPLFYGEISNILMTVTSAGTTAALPTFYVDVGNKDPDHADVILFLETLQNLNVPHKFSNNLGYHDESYWHTHIEEYLLWYDSQLKPPSETP